MSTSTLKSELLSDQDRELIMATQAGLPLVSDPWMELGSQLGMSASEVLERFQKMQASGVIRRVAAVPNHYKLGYRFNGMTVWDVADSEIERLGEQVGQLPFVSHCYRRPRHLPYWSYNLFAMVHGTSSEEVEDKAGRIAEVLGEACSGHTILYSSAILKKTGLRLRKQSDKQ
ncbi:Lrp/AsnC family transcriptional regulator [Marinobacter nauticus]